MPSSRAAESASPQQPPLIRYLLTVDLQKLAEAMYKAPFVCLAHNKFEEGVEDPQFVYANRGARARAGEAVQQAGSAPWRAQRRRLASLPVRPRASPLPPPPPTP